MHSENDTKQRRASGFQGQETAMQTLSATDVAISMAKASGTLRVEECHSERFGDSYWAISDEHGLIEVALTEAEARERTA